MGRLTIALEDSIHQALKEAAARQGRSIGKIIEEGLLLRGIKPEAQAKDLVARARIHAAQTEDKAIEIGLQETRSERRRTRGHAAQR
jgi:plasmid stability protein